MTARSRRVAAAVLAAAGLVTTTATGVAGATPEPAHRDTPGTTVTLITGDRVVLHGSAFTSVVPGPGRERIGFHKYNRDGRLHVVPRDATRALGNGRLDPRLFDVTGLVEAGYDDAKRDTMPLIITGRPPTGVHVTRALPAVGAVATRTAKADAATTFRSLVDDPGVEKIWLDGVRHPDLDRSTAQIGAPAAWQAGFTGAGVKVAVLDTGVDQGHADLAGKEVAERNFTDEPDTADLVGHGTHVAATIASAGGKYKGVAPGAEILDGKVCGAYGCAESWILGGMQWAVDQGADVVNLSLGGEDTPGVDPLEEAVNTLSAQTGALFVIAAGNSGRGGTIGSPGSADAALTVGAVDREDGIAPFSSRGPRAGDGAVKPDITAPGVDVVAAKSSTGRIGTPVDEDHVSMSGTSMATPHVAGAAALIAQQHPDWTGARIKATLMASAKDNPALTAFDQGAGRVDLTEALTTTVTSEPTSLAMGFQQWPHGDDTPITKELTYRNSGAAPVTFPVSVEAKGPRGEPAPAGLFTVTPATVTVPAGGEATVSVTADTRVGTAEGAFSGAVIAGEVLRTPVSVDREVESYDVTTTFVDANGQAPAGYSGVVMGMDNGVFKSLSGTDNTLTTRLPKGDYVVAADVTTGDPQDGPIAVLFQPSLSVTGNTSITFDARTAKPVRITAPDPDPTPGLSELSLTRAYHDTRYGLGMLFFEGFPDNLTLGGVGPALPDDQAHFMMSTQMTGRPVGTTVVRYRFAWLEHGQVPTGFVRTPSRRDLAEVRTTFGPTPAGHEVRHGGLPIAPDGSSPMGTLYPVPAGGDAVDYLTGDGFRWHWLMSQSDPAAGPVADFSIEGRTYRDGRTHEERFNFPVFGPGLPPSRYDYLARLGDDITVHVPLVNDAANNSGWTSIDSARTTLYRDGQKVGEIAYPGGEFTVPPGPAGFRAEVDLVRAPGVSDFSTRVTGAWTFRSDTVAGGQSRKLPLSVVRFAPKLDGNGGTPAGRVLRIPLTVEQQQGADNGQVRRVKVDVSFDDGKTWSEVPVVGGTALVRNDRAGFASLRAKGSDSKGNTFEHSVIRAYRITG
ncbi:subtilisin family serine protease [Saccharothrix ecbatanensis]|uniref:Subtilisin family serine protease n=1 Tax=Saccharothrix ecbatanensis TaxID=1105145 RepID=A0A7W9HVE6_9PSEU|nr:S8 family serine peptidase [Saccharothrix ecbatanensis]MBB5808719.1 subtilisin family serine protease [Saccharothrix ecbatanensis]